MSGFQIFVTGLFVFFIIAGVAVFALLGGAFGGSGIGSVVVWGTMEESTMQYVLDSMRSVDSSLSDTTYLKKDPATYRTELVGAMAAGTGPDLFMVSQADIGAFTDKVIPIPYNAVSQADYLASFIDEGRLFLTPQGALALPFAVDPLVMYWNRDLFAAAGQAQPPLTWSDLLVVAPRLTTLDASQNVKRSAVALGAWQNIGSAKAILSALFMQAGEFVTARASNGALMPTFGGTPEGASEPPAVSALRFYTEFSNPSKTTYSWNRSLPNSTTAFVGGQVAIYFGFASEYRVLLERNPNLGFGVALLPQLKGASSNITYGNMVGLSVPRTARNAAGGIAVAQKLTSSAASVVLVAQTGLPSARRDVAVDVSSNAAASVFVQSALIARGWVDPEPSATDTLLKNMIDSVVSGASDPGQAVSEAAQGFTTLLPYRAGN